uniref:Uncharacterized protein n=1 Tax=Cannabis sativa TaxID=3483 RepID=A0A803R240_CANSA
MIYRAHQSCFKKHLKVYKKDYNRFSHLSYFLQFLHYCMYTYFSRFCNNFDSSSCLLILLFSC